MGSSKDGVQRGKNTFLTKHWGTFLIVEKLRGRKTKPEKLQPEREEEKARQNGVL